MLDHKSNTAELNAAMELLFHGYRTFTAQADALLAKHGWNRVHHRILYFVARQPGLSQQNLLGILQVSKQALHGPMRQLIEAGLLETRPSEQDGRARCLTLTPAGLDLEQQLSDPQREILARVFQKMGPSASLCWVQTMQQLCASSPDTKD